MNEQEKQLLFKDLCARLPYGVKFQGEDSNVYTLDAANYFTLQVEDVVFKPYLRPMSSMTKEEEEEYELLIDCSDYTYFKTSDKVIDWLNKHYFDYRIDPSTGKTLIESGLALEASEDMYKTE